eukprot:CAMPEP_0170353614 /NCGR_PEP_ID=MMETSP0116_2-20130129/78125_1 /TAXON_ID=400756 /ORGANISM="Durinskia baltica, Strain CSIRO CS-38" /LENGTH=844 /DNA_ID=CAMNT_0010607553 /DNA_START=201 /DNA_END=2733 /DNA_ORIENTATION=-
MPSDFVRAVELMLILSLAWAMAPAAGLHDAAWANEADGANAHDQAPGKDEVQNVMGRGREVDRERAGNMLQLTLSIFLFGSIVLSCCLLQLGVCSSCFRATREYVMRKMRGGRQSGVHVLIVWGEDCKDVAERLAYSMHHEYGCRVRGAPQFWLEGVWRSTSADDWTAAEGAEAILVVLSPRVFESEVSRRTLADLCTKRSDIPIIPVYAGGIFAKDDLKSLYKSKIALRLSQPELASLELIRRQVFAENMADIENEHHTRRTKMTLRRIVQRFENGARPSLLTSCWSQLAAVADTVTDPYYHDVFISYSTADNRQTFENLRACFVDLGCNVFNPTVDMQGAKVSLEVMQRHVRGSRVLVVMPGPGHCKSMWCRGEVLAGIEAKIPIVRAFAGQATSMSALLAFREEDPRASLAGEEADEETVEEVRKIRDFTLQPPMVDVRHEDHTEETVKAAKRIAFKHLPWVRRRWMLRRTVRAFALPTLAVVLLFNSAADFGPRMQRCCNERDAEGLRTAIWWVKRLPLGRYMHTGHLVRMLSCLHEIEVSKRIRGLTDDIHNQARVGDTLQELNEIVAENKNDQKILLNALSALQDCWTIKATTLSTQDRLFDLIIEVIRYALAGRRTSGDYLTLITAIQILTSIFARDFLSGSVLRIRSDKAWDEMREVLNMHTDDWRVVIAAVRLLRASQAPTISSAVLNRANNGSSLLETVIDLTVRYEWNEGVEADLTDILARIAAADGNTEPKEFFAPRLCNVVAEVLSRPNTSLAVVEHGVAFFDRLAEREQPQERCSLLMGCGGLQALSGAVARIDAAVATMSDRELRQLEYQRPPRRAIRLFAAKATETWA